MKIKAFRDWGMAPKILTIFAGTAVLVLAGMLFYYPGQRSWRKSGLLS